MQQSGLSAEELFQRGEEISYDDFTTLNRIFSEISKRDVSLLTSLGKGVDLAIPVVASPMDSVVGAEMAIAMAQLGGIAVLHHNYKDSDGNSSINRQVEEIKRVKRYQNGFIKNPLTVSPKMTIAEVIDRGNQFGGHPVSTFPVTEDGESNGKLVGILRKDDYWITRGDYTVEDRMLKLSKLIIGRLGISLEEAREMLWENHIKSLPIVDEEGNLDSLVTRGDIEKMEQFPNATVDENARLRVLFAVDTWPASYERLERCFAAGADGVVVDTSQGHTTFAHQMLRHIAEKYPEKLLIGGNVSTAEAAVALANLGFVDAYRCGQGSGSICTTADVIGSGRAGVTAVYECSKAVRSINSNMVTIADGGLRHSGDIFKALSLGAGAVMLGSMLAGHKECPGKKVFDDFGRPMMEYWGMGSNKARVGGESRARDYGSHEEGIEVRVPYKGELRTEFPQVIDALQHSFEVMNCRSIEELHKIMEKGELRFGKRSIAALAESKPRI